MGYNPLAHGYRAGGSFGGSVSLGNAAALVAGAVLSAANGGRGRRVSPGRDQLVSIQVACGGWERLGGESARLRFVAVGSARVSGAY
jgi:hypothetical protein